jgi:hypothetical protein
MTMAAGPGLTEAIAVPAIGMSAMSMLVVAKPVV